jgi:hypothetical protein
VGAEARFPFTTGTAPAQVTTTMKIKTTTAFRALAAAHANRAKADKRFLVKSVNKDGSVSRMAPTKSAWQLDAFATAEGAEKRRAQLEEMNPGCRFAVVPI